MMISERKEGKGMKKEEEGGICLVEIYFWERKGRGGGGVIYFLKNIYTPVKMYY